VHTTGSVRDWKARGVGESKGRSFWRVPSLVQGCGRHLLNIRNGIHSSTENVSFGLQIPRHPPRDAESQIATHGPTMATAGSGETWTCAVDRRAPLTTIPPANMSQWSEAASRKPRWALPEWPTIRSLRGYPRTLGSCCALRDRVEWRVGGQQNGSG
jgi:hypothetical protein